MDLFLLVYYENTMLKSGTCHATSFIHIHGEFCLKFTMGWNGEVGKIFA